MINRKALYIVLAIFLSCTVLVIAGCSSGATNTDDNKLKIVTTLFPDYDFAKQIVKDKAEVVLLLPPGVEAHSYDPTPQDIARVHSSSVFIYTSPVMEPWADKIIKTLDKDGRIIVESSKGIQLSKHQYTEDEHEGDDEGHDEEYDPHVWVDPVYAKVMVNNIKEAVSAADPKNEDFYSKNAEDYISRLTALDEKIKDTLSKVRHKTIIYGGHFVFGYFTQRYGLDYISPYHGFSPNSEPTPQKIAELINKMNKTNIKTIFYEELIDPKVSKVISEQTGAKMLLLHGAHNVSKEELNSGITYIQIMEKNLENLKQGLGYDE